MTDREKLVALLCEAMLRYDRIKDNQRDNPFHVFADHLLANGVTFTPAVPGPSEDDPNIMELCFHNGERHMRDRIKTSLLKLSEDVSCVTISQVIKIMEDL